MNITKAEEALNRLTERIMRFSQWNGRLVPEDASDVETLRAFIAQAGEDAERYRVLRHSLSSQPSCTSLWMPQVAVPFTNCEQTYTPAGLDAALDEERAARSAAVAPTQLGDSNERR